MANTYTRLENDTFIRASENPLSDGGNWTIVAASGTGLEINSDTVIASTDNVNGFGLFTGFNSDTWPNDQFVEVVLSAYNAASSAAMGVLGRSNSGVTTVYFCELVSGSLGSPCGIELGKLVSGSETTLGTFTGTFNVGDVLRLEMQGTTLNVYQNGTLRIGPITDTSITSGTPGIVAYAESNPLIAAMGGTAGTPPTQESSLTGWDAGNIYAGTVSSVGLDPNTVTYPSTSEGTVTLSTAAPVGGIVVSLMSSDTTIATVPTTVTVLSGNTTATFTVSPQNKTGNATITTSIGGGSSADAIIGVTAASNVYTLINEAHELSYPSSSQPNLSLAVTKGNLIMAWLTCLPTSGFKQIIYDKHNTYIPIVVPQTGGYGIVVAWCAIAARTETLSIDFFEANTADEVPGTGILQAARANLGFPACQVAQFSGNYGNPFDAFAFATGSGTALSESVATAASAGLVIGIPIPSSGSAPVETAGWTNIAGVETGNSAIYALETDAGTYTPTMTQSPSTEAWGMVAISFKAAISYSNYTIAGALGADGTGATVLFVSTTLNTIFTTTADGLGNYVSPAMPNDTYVVYPEKVGVLFTSAQLEETLNGSDITSVNFTASAIDTTLVLTTTISDTMQRANENPLSDGGNWDGDGNEIPPDDPQAQLLSHEACMSDATIYANYAGPWSGDGLSIWVGTPPSDDQFCQFQLDVLSAVGGASLNIRVASDDASSYSLIINNNSDGTCSLHLMGVAVPFSLPILSGSGIPVIYTWQKLAEPFSLGDTLGFAVIGSTIYILHNGTVIGNYTDTTLTTGTVMIGFGGFNVADAQISHFIAGSAAPGYVISGSISGAGGPGATVTLSGDSSQVVTADGSGNYTFASVVNGSYTVTPTNGAVIFTPTNNAVTVNSADQPNIDFSSPAGGNFLSNMIVLMGAG